MLHGVFTTPVYANGMYEGPIKAEEPAGGEQSPILRQLRWTDLVARLAATRGVRGSPDDAADDQYASFAAFHLGEAASPQRGVNRDVLAHGKFSRILPPDAANTAGDGDRET